MTPDDMSLARALEILRPLKEAAIKEANMVKRYDSRGYEKDEEPLAPTARRSTTEAGQLRAALAVPAEAITVMPFVGAIVHYMSPGAGPATLAAIVTQVDSDGCFLAVFTTTDTTYLKAPYCGDKPTPGCWSWPA